jgi:hypothetical protein
MSELRQTVKVDCFRVDDPPGGAAEVESLETSAFFPDQPQFVTFIVKGHHRCVVQEGCDGQRQRTSWQGAFGDVQNRTTPDSILRRVILLARRKFQRRPIQREST